MTSKIKLLQVGCGNMGKAMLHAWAQKIPLEAWVIQPSLKSQAEFSKYPHIHFISSLAALPTDFEPDIIVFTNKPQQATQIIPHYTQFASSAVFVSIMTGVSLSWLSKNLGSNAAIVRLMPNLAASIGQSMSIAVANTYSTVTHTQQVTTLGETIGKLLWVNQESMLEAATPISGSGPAYFFLLTECFTQSALELGFDQASAELLANQTFLGSALLLEQSTKNASELREAVSSKGGMTLASLEVLNHPDTLATRVQHAIKAGLKRARELSL